MVVNEETLTDSQQSSSSSRNKKSIKGTLKEDELKDMSEEVQKTMIRLTILFMHECVSWYYIHFLDDS